MVNNIVIFKKRNNDVYIIFSDANNAKEAREMANKEGDEFIAFIPTGSTNILLESCLMDYTYKSIIEAFLTSIYREGMRYGATEMRNNISKTVSSFMEARFKKARA